MNHVRLKCHGASVQGVKPEILRAMAEAPKSFARYGFDCWLTTCVRPLDVDSLHAYGMAADFDASTPVSESAGKLIEDDLADVLGNEYYVSWHKSKRGDWHLHCEFDPGNKGVAPYVHRI